MLNFQYQILNGKHMEHNALYIEIFRILLLYFQILLHFSSTL